MKALCASESAVLRRAVIAKFHAAHRVLIMTHLRPDGDALGAAFGLREVLRENGLQAETLIPAEMPHRYQALCKGGLSSVSPEELNGFDLIVSLDCANVPRLGCGSQLTVEELRKRDFINIDHHDGNSIGAGLNYVQSDAESTSGLVAGLLNEFEIPFGAKAATLLLTGLMTDTGSFRFANTKASTFRTAAMLMERGAKLETVANQVFFCKPYEQLQFEAELVSTCFKRACSGKVAYAFVPDELMKKHHFEMREDEGLIDLLRGLEGVTVAMLVHHREDGFRISLRSKDSAHPVGDLAREYGGGGHAMAAGMTLDLPDFEAVEKLLLPKIEALLDK